MITDKDKQYLRESGIEIISDMVINSKNLKDKLTFKEHVLLYDQTKKLTYEEVITLLVTEDIREFEGKFSKFLKYSIAAIAGMAGGLFGPPLTMFILYLYRKSTDTCEQHCFTTMPTSTDRKLCRYQCQLTAAKQLERKVRSEMSKCSQTSKPDKCEKALKGQYIRWSKRVQLLTVKYNRAKLGNELKLRKQRQKELMKTAKSLRASVDQTLSKNDLISFVSENKKLRQDLTFEQHLKLYQVCTYIQEDDLQGSVKFVKVDPKKEKIMRSVASIGLGIASPIPLFSSIIIYMSRKYSASCAAKCLANNKLPKSVCYTHCSYMSAKYSSQVLKKSIASCNKSKNPVKCKNKIYKLLMDWKQREAERKVKFDLAYRKAARKGK